METSLFLTIISITAAVFFLAGIVTTIIGIMWWQRVRGFVQIAEQVEGTVIELIERRGGKGGPTYAPVVEYTDHLGQRQEHHAKTGASWQRFAIGDKVRIPSTNGVFRPSVFLPMWSCGSASL